MTRVEQSDDAHGYAEQRAHVPDLMHAGMPCVGDEERVARLHLPPLETPSYFGDLRTLEDVCAGESRKAPARGTGGAFHLDLDHARRHAASRSCLRQLDGKMVQPLPRVALLVALDGQNPNGHLRCSLAEYCE